jgi:death on curing protein
LRDARQLESAVGAKHATFGGQSVFADAVEVAAAKLFYPCRNHTFTDGNKRTALGVCLVFLELNELALSAPLDGWYDHTMGVASGALDRDAATQHIRSWLE